MQDNTPLPMTLSVEQVAHFLRHHPTFFEQHASLLTEIYLPSPHGAGAISLVERQQLAQRDKIRVLEVKLAELFAIAEENDDTSRKVHDFSLQLMASQNFADLQQRMLRAIEENFAVTPFLYLWLKPNDHALDSEPVFMPVSEAFSDWVMALERPYCGIKPASADITLPPQLQSFAFIPLAKKSAQTHVFGVLVLGAEDAQHFSANMGTVYLERLGEWVSTALLRYL